MTIRVLAARVRAFFEKRRLDSELDDEMQAHLDLLAEEYARRGLPAREAREAARREFGAAQQIKEVYRDQRGLPALDSLRQDVGYTLRVMRKSPAFTMVAVLSLSLGIGLNTAVFSLIDQLLFREANVSDPATLYSLISSQPRGGYNSRFAIPMYEQLRNNNRSFEGMSCWGMSRMGVRVGAQPAEMVSVAYYAGNYFSLLGLHPLLGRTLTPDDDQPGRPAVALIGYRFWKEQFAGRNSVIGETIETKSVPLLIVGVMPLGFISPATTRSLDIMLPAIWMTHFQLNDSDPVVGIIARLKRPIALQSAAAELNVVFSRVLSKTLDSTLPDKRKRELLSQSIELRPAGRGNLGAWEDYRLRVSLLTGVVGIVLLISCANVANLLLARAAARRRELAVRLAIGAGRARLVRQLLIESMLLGLIGGSAGLLLAVWAQRGLATILGLRAELALDWRVLGFTGAISLLTGVLFGVLPALRSTRVDLNRDLKERAPQSAVSADGRKLPLGKALIALQVGLSLVLMIGAGLLLRTVRNLDRIDPGFDPDNVLLFWTYPTVLGYDGPKELRLYEELLRHFHRIPGVLDASMARHNLMQRAFTQIHVVVAGDPGAPFETAAVSQNAIAPRFFATMRIPLMAGRDFAEAEIESAPRVAIVNQQFARDRFGAENPVGKHVILQDQPRQDVVIVGVVRDFRYYSMRDSAETPAEQIFVPYTQAPREMLGQMCFMLRTAGEPLKWLPAAIHAAQTVEPGLPVVNSSTQAAEWQSTAAQERGLAKLTAIFGGLAVVLACVGLYGVMSYQVARRTGEIGIRMALGAGERHVVMMVLRESALLVLLGVALGIPAALASTRYLGSILYGVQTYDAATFVAAALLLAVVAALAAFLPAARAARVDPLVALRCE